MKFGKHTVIEFKTKPQSLCVYGAPDQLQGWHITEKGLKVPEKLGRRHVIVCGQRLSGVINSDLVSAAIMREVRARFGPAAKGFDLDDLPTGVTVTGDFMKTVYLDLTPLEEVQEIQAFVAQ